RIEGDPDTALVLNHKRCQPAIRLCSSNDTPGSFGKPSFWVPGEVMVAKLKLKGIDGGSPPVMGLRFNLGGLNAATLPGPGHGED
ncbi:hypothetical protein JTE90_015836, partial [Oedothorax gibbosus]